MYTSVILDECGDIVAFCKDLSEIRIEELLETHPEWHRACISAGTCSMDDFYA